MRFLDTNVLVYAFEADERGAIAQSLLEAGGIIAIQSLNEFTDVMRRKLRMSWHDIGNAIEELLLSCTLFEPVSAEIHAAGRMIAEQHQLRIFDAMLVATALAAGCDTFVSEDLHAGMVFDGRLTVWNPFG